MEHVRLLSYPIAHGVETKRIKSCQDIKGREGIGQKVIFKFRSGIETDSVCWKYW